MYSQLSVLCLLGRQRPAVRAGDACGAFGPALGVEHDGEGTRVQRDVGDEQRRLCWCFRRGTQGSVTQLSRRPDNVRELLVGYVVDLPYRGPWQYVVELVEEERLPGGFELFALVIATVERGQRGEGFRLEQTVLGLPVELLDPCLGGEGTPVQLEVELAGPPWQPFSWELLEELIDVGHAEVWHRGVPFQAGVVLEHLLARAAAAVAPPEGEEALGVVALALEVAPGAVEILGSNVAVVVLAGVFEVVGDHRAPVYALPLVEVVGKLVGLAPVELVGEETLHPRAPEQLRQRRREPEGVGQPGHPRAMAELLLEVSLAIEHLAHHRLAGWDLAVRLHPRAAYGLPASLLDPPPYPLEDLRRPGFDPLVELGRGLIEHEIVIALHKREHAREGPTPLAHGLGDGPQPGQVEVRVARQGEAPDRRILGFQLLQAGGDPRSRLAHGTPRLLGNGLHGSRRGRQAPRTADGGLGECLQVTGERNLGPGRQ